MFGSNSFEDMVFSYIARDDLTSTVKIFIGDRRVGSSLLTEHLLNMHETLGQISSTSSAKHGSKHG